MSLRCSRNEPLEVVEQLADQRVGLLHGLARLVDEHALDLVPARGELVGAVGAAPAARAARSASALGRAGGGAGPGGGGRSRPCRRPPVGGPRLVSRSSGGRSSRARSSGPTSSAGRRRRGPTSSRADVVAGDVVAGQVVAARGRRGPGRRARGSRRPGRGRRSGPRSASISSNPVRRECPDPSSVRASTGSESSLLLVAVLLLVGGVPLVDGARLVGQRVAAADVVLFGRAHRVRSSVWWPSVPRSSAGRRRPGGHWCTGRRRPRVGRRGRHRSSGGRRSWRRSRRRAGGRRSGGRRCGGRRRRSSACRSSVSDPSRASTSDR